MGQMGMQHLLSYIANPLLLIHSFPFQRSVHNISYAPRIWVWHLYQYSSSATLSCLSFIFTFCTSSLHSDIKWLTFWSILPHILHFRELFYVFFYPTCTQWLMLCRHYQSLVSFFRFPFFIHSQLLWSLTYSVPLINSEYILSWA